MNQEGARESSRSLEPPAPNGLEGESESTSTPEGHAAKDAEQPPLDIASLQLGHRRYVYAAYMSAALGIAFIATKAIGAAWYRFYTWRPALGEPRDDIVFPVAALIGAGVAYSYWRSEKSRTLAEETAEELAKVSWPAKPEVGNNTTVVVVTTAFATVLFALMDQFWGFVTKWVYGT